jgi:hypothetical protein
LLMRDSRREDKRAGEKDISGVRVPYVSRQLN